jgi:serine/threonine-protein kinase
MSPQQARGAVDELDARTDIFSLGAMLYELLAGSPPYNQPTERERLLASAAGAQIERPVMRLRRTDSRRAARIPREVEAVAMKATASDPAKRYQSAEEFVDDIQRYLEGHSVTASPDTLIQRAKKWVRRNRVMVAWLIAVVCAVAIAIVGARVLIQRSMIKNYSAEAQKTTQAAQAEREKRSNRCRSQKFQRTPTPI